jgi:hypothetical protein
MCLHLVPYDGATCILIHTCSTDMLAPIKIGPVRSRLGHIVSVPALRRKLCPTVSWCAVLELSVSAF